MSGVTVGFDFLRDAISAATPVTEAEARRLVEEQFGWRVTARALGSQQDTNLLLLDRGDPVGVLKIANAVFGEEEIAAQDAAADQLARACPDLRIATLRRGAAGRPLRAVVPSPDGPRVARVLRHLTGGTLTGPGYLAPVVVAGLGRVAGRASVALAGFRHPGLDRALQWDLRYAAEVVARLATHVADPGQRAQVQAATAAAWATVEAVAGELPHQAVHLDITDDNVVRTGREPDGLIDFGDLTTTWAVAEPAITISSVLHHAGAEPCSVLPAVRAFHAVRPLSGAEVTALWPLTVLRAAALVVSGHHQAAIDGDNAYAVDALEHEWRIFAQATSVPLAVMTALVRDALEPAVGPPPVSGHRLVSGPVTALDLSVDADTMDRGAWRQPGVADRLAGQLPGAVATQYARPRLAGAPVLSPVSPPSVPTGVDLWTANALGAPWDGIVAEASVQRLVLVAGDRTLTLTGPLDPHAGTGAAVTAGDRLATPRSGRVHVAVRRTGAPEPPPLVRPEYAPGWLAAALDPSPLLGLPPVPPDPCDLLARRAAAFASVQEHYYADPPRIERGWRHHLIAADGRAYLDMVNNVAVLGHAHPRIEAAVTRQLRRLNTNSRFHYAAVVELAERLAALLPDPLDTVFLVNSGSEADDLAIRLALAATGRRDVVAVREAYHGWTYATDAVSTSVADNPNALTTRPDWVHTVPAPYRDGTAADAVAVIDELVAAGRPPAAFIAEAFYGNAGGMLLPEGLPGRGLRRRPAPWEPDHRRRGAGRLRPAGLLVLGLRAAGRAARHRRGRQGDGQRAPARGRGHHAGGRRALPGRRLLLLLDRRQPGVVRGRLDRAGRAGRGGPGGQRRTRR